MRVLIIEDEQKLARSLAQGLSHEHYAVDMAFDGSDGFQKALTGKYDVIILDVLLPKKNGFDVCKDLRMQGISTPIIILSAKGETIDKIKGLDSGADDYIAKPFGFDELVARIRSVLRRRSSLKPTTLQIADLVLDPASYEVRRGNTLIHLTSKEYNLLDYLMRREGEGISREELLTHVWGKEGDAESNKLDVCVRYLRRKIDDKYPVKLIQTVRGVGYKIKSPEK